jgi:assimilatory nitrate reductase catalytic subunit
MFFVAPHATFPKAGQTAQLLGQAFDPIARLSLLAGPKAGAAPSGKIVCSCLSVGEAAICNTIRTKRLTSPTETGPVLRAGTNYGSCIPELKKLLATDAAQLSEVA